MSRPSHRPDRAAVTAAPAPLDSAASALEVVRLALARDEPSVVAVPLDRARTGRLLWCVDGTTGDDDVVTVAQLVLAGTDPPPHGLVLASGRPGRSALPDVDDWWRWSVLRGACHDHAVDLLDWFVVADQVAVSMGDLDDLPPGRWDPS